MKIRLLLVEDNPDDALLIIETLQNAGIEADWKRTCDLDELKSLLASGSWDAVVSDYSMPKMSAEEALRIVRAHDADLPFILASGTVDPEIAVDMMREGMQDFVLKDNPLRLAPALRREVQDSRYRLTERITRSELFILQKQFRDTLEQAAVGMTQIDRGGHYLWVNQRFCEIVGRDSDDIVGLHFFDLTHPEDREAETGILEKLRNGELREMNREKRYLREDGSEVWTMVSVSAILDSDGRLSHFASVVQDISEKKEAQQKLVRSEQYVRAVLDSLPFQTAVVDREGTIQMVNSAWEHFALTNGNPDVQCVGVGASYTDVCPDDLREQIRSVARGEIESIALEYPCHSPDEERWFLMMAAPLESQEGGAVITHVAITARVLAEQSLERREQEYRTIVETMGEGLVAIDLEGRIIFANPRVMEIAGYTPAEVIGSRADDYLSDPGERSIIKDRLRDSKDGRAGYETTLRHASGSAIPVAVNSVPRYDQDGNAIGRLIVLSDVTDRRHAEIERQRLTKQIEEMNRIESLGKLAGTMAHEFNNVLMGIQPFADVIQRSVDPSNGAVMNATRFIMDAVNRGRRVSQEVLRFSRPSPPVRKKIGADRLVEDVGQISRGVLQDKHELHLDVTTAEAVSVDREQIVQVFTNLIINARDAVTGRGRITIGARVDQHGTKYQFGVVKQPEQFVHFTVSDNGSGIPPHMIKQIFEPLVTSKRNGNGLGLAVAHQIITAHGGLVFAESTEGVGTAIHMFLPKARTMESQGATDEEDNLALSSTKN